MNRLSDREMRIVAIEAQVREIRNLSERIDVVAAEVARMREAQILTVAAIQKLSRELGAQRERYPLD